MICNLCKGAQNLYCKQPGGAHEWYVCPACGGAGVRFLCAPASIELGRAQTDFCKPELTRPLMTRENPDVS